MIDVTMAREYLDLTKSHFEADFRDKAIWVKADMTVYESFVEIVVCAKLVCLNNPANHRAVSELIFTRDPEDIKRRVYMWMYHELETWSRDECQTMKLNLWI